MTAVQDSSFNLCGDGDTERIIGARATAGFFGVFDMPAERGRVFTKDEEHAGRLGLVSQHGGHGAAFTPHGGSRRDEPAG